MLTSFAGGRVFGARYGTDTPNLLLLHGWGGSHQQMAQLAAGRNAISLDLPGFGATPPPDGVWGAAEYAKCVEPVLEEMADRVVVVGFSFGGRVAVHLACRRSHAVSALVLTGAPLLRRAPAKKAPLGFRLMKRANRLGLVSDSRMEAERRRRGSVDYRNASGVMRDVLVKSVNESYEDQLRQLECTVRMVWGENDTEAPVEVARRALTMYSAASSLDVVEGGTHFLPMEDPAPINAVIDQVLPR